MDIVVVRIIGLVAAVAIFAVLIVLMPRIFGVNEPVVLKHVPETVRPPAGSTAAPVVSPASIGAPAPGASPGAPVKS